MAYTFKPLSNNQVYITQDGRAMGTFSTTDAAKYGYGAPTTPQQTAPQASQVPTNYSNLSQEQQLNYSKGVVPGQTPVQTPTPQSTQSTQQAEALKAQIAQLQAQQSALTQYKVTDTNALPETVKTSLGVTPSKTPQTPQTPQTPVTKSTVDTSGQDLVKVQQDMAKIYADSQKSQQDLLKSISDKTSSETLAQINKYQSDAQASLKAYMDEQNALIDQIKNQPSAIQALQQFREQQGLPQMEAQLSSIDQTIITTEGLLNNIEADIRKRTEGLPVSEAAARRLTAMEQAPISKQLSEQLAARQKIAAGLEAKQNTVNQFMSAQQEDLAKQQSIINAKLGVSEKAYGAKQDISSTALELSQNLQNSLNQLDLKQLDMIASDADYKSKLAEFGFTQYQQLRAEQIAQANRGEDFQNELIRLKLESELNKADAGYDTEVKQDENGNFVSISTNKATGKSTVTDLGVVGKTTTASEFGDSGLTGPQATMFNGLVNKYNASPLIAAADRTVVLKGAIDAARANPSDGATQLSLIYSYVQALDTYQSAVREGELSLVNSIDSKIGKIENWKNQIMNGQIVRPEVAREIADAADLVVNTIYKGAQNKAKSYESQAKVLGLEGAWQKYQQGFSAQYNQGGTQSNPNDPLGIFK